MKGYAFRLRYGALFYKKRRLFLSILGVVIGVAAIVVMVSVSEGSKAKLMREFETFSPDTLTVVAGRVRLRGGRPITTEKYTTLKLEDAWSLEGIFGVVRVAPVYEGSVVAEYGENSMRVTVVGSTPQIFAIRRYKMAYGRIFTHAEAMKNGKVAVIGYKVCQELFGCRDPVGKRIRIRKLPFLVVGVMEKMGTDASGRDLDSQIIIPISSATNRVFNVDHISSIFVQVASELFLQDVSDNVARILRKRHGIRRGFPDDFSVLKAEEILKNKERSAMIFSIFTISIAFISIIVGSFGVMAVMILSVRERTVEVGLRKALGATEFDIVKQFLEESAVITLFGGIAGSVLGIMMSFVASKLFKYPFVLSPIYLLLSLLIVVALGIVAGIYPARKASKVDPVVSLRGS